MCCNGTIHKKTHTKTAAKLHLIPVGVALVWASHRDANVVCLLLRRHGQLGTKSGQMQTSNLLIQVLGQQVDIILVCLSCLVLLEVNLCQDLVGERARHDERGMSCGAAQVAQAAGCKHDDAMAIRERKAVHLGLDVLNLDAWEPLQAVHVDLVVKVPDVADNGVVLHLLHVLQSDDLEVACARDKDVNFTYNGLQGCHLESLHASLQRADGVDLCDKHACTTATHGEGTALA